MNLNVWPPASKKACLFSMFISSNVSRQSETNEGVTTVKFYIPSAGMFSIVSAEHGLSHSSLPSLLWNAIV